MPSDSDLSIGRGLEGKRIIVTGASSGIGKATALLLERVGASVIAVGLDKGRLSELEGEFSDPSRHLILSVDLSGERCDEEIMKPAISRCGGVDAVMLAGATLKRKDLKDVTVEDWDHQIETNLRSTFLIARAVAEHLKENNRAGSIVQPLIEPMSSISVMAPSPSSWPGFCLSSVPSRPSSPDRVR